MAPAVPAALSPATVRVRVGATAAYAGDATVSSAIEGAGGVEVASGRVTFSSSASSFTGGLRVKAGGVAAAGASWAQAPQQLQATGPFGLFAREKSFGKVFVEDGGMVDLNGQNHLAYVYTIAGSGVATGGVDAPGALVNLGAALNVGTNATRPLVKSGWGIPWQANGLTLSGNATIGATGCDLGIVSDNGATANNGYFYGGTLTLGTNTLTKAGSGTLWLWSNPLSVSGAGFFVIDGGTVDIRKGMYSGGSSRIVVGEGAVLRTDAHVFAHTITNMGTIEIVGTGLITNSANYAGNGTVVKNGSGTAVVPFHDGSKSRYVVNGGTLKVQRRTTVGGVYAFVTEEEPAGNQLVDVVASGAAFDFNGFNDTSVSVRLAAGATVANTGANIINSNMQMVQLILAGNAMAHAEGTFGLLAPGYKEARLELNGHDLTLTGTNSFWLCNTTVLGAGTVVVSNGTLNACRAASAGADWGIAVATGGTFTVGSNVRVKDFVNEGVVNGGSTLTVTGTLTAGNAIPKLTLTDGATVKLAGTNAAQRVSITLSASGTITVDASAVPQRDLYAAGRVPVLTAPSIPSGVTWQLYDPQGVEGVLRTVAAGGVSTLYLVPRNGLLISFH